MSDDAQSLRALGRAIREVREQRGLSAAELAAASGLTPHGLGQLEAGLLDPTYDTLCTLAEALGVRPAALIERTEGQRS